LCKKFLRDSQEFFKLHARKTAKFFVPHKPLFDKSKNPDNRFYAFFYSLKKAVYTEKLKKFRRNAER